MARTPTLPRFAPWWAWVAVAALLLKAAVPLLASTSAQWQGKALVEVCTGYGVATVALDPAGPGSHAPASAAAEVHGDHCTLSSLLGLAAPPAPAALPAAPPVTLEAGAAPHAPPACDACARWVAGLKHGPPRFA